MSKELSGHGLIQYVVWIVTYHSKSDEIFFLNEHVIMFLTLVFELVSSHAIWFSFDSEFYSRIQCKIQYICTSLHGRESKSPTSVCTGKYLFPILPQSIDYGISIQEGRYLQVILVDLHQHTRHTECLLATHHQLGSKELLRNTQGLRPAKQNLWHLSLEWQIFMPLLFKLCNIARWPSSKEEVKKKLFWACKL